MNNGPVFLVGMFAGGFLTLVLIIATAQHIDPDLRAEQVVRDAQKKLAQAEGEKYRAVHGDGLDNKP